MKRWVSVSAVAAVVVAVTLLGLLANLSPASSFSPSTTALSAPSAPSATPQGVPLPPGHYLATFTETGLPNGTQWGILFNGTLFQNGSTFSSNGTLVFTITPRISFEVVNRTYPFRPFCLCGPESYSVNSTVTSPLKIAGASVTVQTAFQLGTVSTCVSPNGCAPQQPPYPIRFAASGLPSGTPWGVNFDNATVFLSGTSLSYLMWNGTYRYAVEASGWQPNLASGNVVVNGAGMNESITFTEVTYPVTFSETGLPSGASWSVTVNGVTTSSATPTIAFAEPNGTYTLGANPDGAYYAQSGGNGTFTVNGAARSFSVTYAWTVTLTFSETGLANGSTWSINVTSADPTSWQITSSASNITFHLPANATYNYTIGVPSGQSASTSSGSVTLGSAGQTLPPVTISPTSSGSSSVPWTYVIIGVVIAAAVAGVAIALVMRSRRR